ncbi:MAG: UDP-N-acetylglucosamine 1-carboxyvinyltransferase [Solobacterium sp.]|nr:UDP-N-acetylglucosamine 1-carboxyvinyltransferase [Solobacterium sp.]
MQEVLRIEGGHELEGEVTISGSKNATVALIPAAVLANGPVTIVGVPDIADVENLAVILRLLNVDVVRTSRDHLIIDPQNMVNTDLLDDAVSKLRASYYFMGALLGKFGHVRMKMPGGCPLGERPIDLHLKGFEALGATCTEEEDGSYTIHADELVGAKIFLDISSVGATINIMMAAAYAKGRTTIKNAAREPEIIDVATLLNKMGARIRGAGTNVITIDGVNNLNGCFHEIIPDRIEAGTYIIIAAAMAKEMTINSIIPAHLDSLLAKLRDMGVDMEVDVDRVTIRHSDRLQGVDVTTMPYPGFATDLQQPLTALMTMAEGKSHIEDTIYADRFLHCKELKRMGADIEVLKGEANINGPTPLHGARVCATDLRCGASLVIAALMAEGVTEITNVYHIDRGYAEIDRKLTSLGAVVSRHFVE